MENFKREMICTISILVIIFVSMVSGFFMMRKIIPIEYKSQIIKEAGQNGIEPEFIASVIFAESRFDKNAKSNKGAVGLMQLMPSTAKSFYKGENFSESMLYSASENIKIGSAYLKYLFDKYNDEVTVLACYNAGEKIVIKWINGESKLKKSQIEYKETLKYIEKVQKMKKIYKIYF